MVDDVEATVLVIQHVRTIHRVASATWLTEAGWRLEVVRGFAGEPLPADLDGFDGLWCSAATWAPTMTRRIRGSVATKASAARSRAGSRCLPWASASATNCCRWPRGAVEPAGGGQQGGAPPVVTTPEAADGSSLLRRSCAPAAHRFTGTTMSSPYCPRRLSSWRASRRLASRRFAWALAPGACRCHPEVDVETVRLWAREADRAADGWPPTSPTVAGRDRGGRPGDSPGLAPGRPTLRRPRTRTPGFGSTGYGCRGSSARTARVIDDGRPRVCEVAVERKPLDSRFQGSSEGLRLKTYPAAMEESRACCSATMCGPTLPTSRWAAGRSSLDPALLAP